MPPIPVLVALADPTRCRILEILHTGARPVHLLAAEFAISRPAISRHLRVLKRAGLISETKTGRENHYVMHAGRLEGVRYWLDEFLPRPAPITVTVAAEPPVPTPEPEPAAAVPAPKPRKAPAVQQMGFDF